MKTKITIKELPRQRKERRSTRAVNTPQQYRLDDFAYARYGVRGR